MRAEAWDENCNFLGLSFLIRKSGDGDLRFLVYELLTKTK